MNNETETELQKAIKVLQDALKEDKGVDSYYFGWQANIACAFIDEYKRLNPNMSEGNEFILTGIANNAAKNFLELFLKQ